MKANGFALSLLPLFAILIGRRFDLLRRPGLWASAAICAVAAPWYYFTREAAVSGWQGSTNVQWLAANVATVNTRFLVQCAGVSAILLALVGTSAQLVRRERSPFWVCAAAMVLSVWTFHTLIAPVREARHFIYSAPFVLLFAVSGLKHICLRISHQAAQWAIVATATVLFVWEAGLPPAKAAYGATAAVSALRQDLKHQAGNVLVSSVNGGEGAFIAETVMAETPPNRRAPGYRLFRATTLLARGEWGRPDYALLLRTPDELLSALGLAKVRWLAIDTHPPRKDETLPPHHGLVRQMIAVNPSSFRRLPYQGASFYELYEFR